MDDELRCPYCNEVQKVERDFHEYNDNYHTCSACGEEFMYGTTISIHYHPRKAPCITDYEKHEWELNPTIPLCTSLMYCKICGEVRGLTEEEMKEYHIPTCSEYYKKEEK